MSERPLPVWVAVLSLALALVFAGLCAVTPAFADGGGSVDLSVSVKGGEGQVAQGGSVDLSINVGAKEAPAASGTSVDLSVNVASRPVHQVSFVGYYCDEKGDVELNDDGSQKKETLGLAQDVLDKGHATAPVDLTRTYDMNGATAEYWVDGWYAYGANGSLNKVDLSTYEVEGGMTFVCYWKRGYVVTLDPNNGSDVAGAAVFDGTVDGMPQGHVAVARDVAFEDANDSGDPDGYAAPEFPAAVRAGYVFKGWYWAGGDADPGKDHGRVPLDEAQGAVAQKGDAKGYDFFRQHCANGATPTLYAKWELGPYVTIDLEGALKDASTSSYAKLWCWPGRGYALAAPAADREVEPGFVVAGIPDGGIDVTSELGIAQNPTHQLSTKVFTGWGYEVQGDGGKLEKRELVSAEKLTGTGFGYRLMPAAAAYLSSDIASWQNLSAEETDPAAPAGSRRAMWSALYDTARISVSAPFRVTFQKEGTAGSGSGGASGAATVLPYSADELEGKLGALPAIYSPAQGFFNRSTAGEGASASPVSVYVSAVECIDRGADVLFPCIGDDRRVLGLGETADFIGGSGSKTALRFGYDGFLGQDRVSAGADPASWIVLPPAQEPAAGEDPEPSKELYFGLDLTKVELNRAAIAMAGGSSSAAASSYVETLANVKYTYSVVP